MTAIQHEIARLRRRQRVTAIGAVAVAGLSIVLFTAQLVRALVSQ